MNYEEYIATRLINDYLPIVKKHKYKKDVSPKVIGFFILMTYEKRISVQQFRDVMAAELEVINK